MNNVCTPATAARLKAAGFPQPAPAPGQVWYAHTGRAYCLTNARFAGEWYAACIGNGGNNVFNPGNQLTFAPGVADLLRELGNKPVVLWWHDKKKAFVVEEIDSEFCRQLALNENPAEAMAAAWL